MTEATMSDNLAQPDIVPVSHWDSTEYHGDVPAGERYLMEVVDHREECGQLFVDVGAEDGDIDDILTASFEISDLPGTRTHVQVVHLHFNDNEMAFTVFKQGSTYILRPDANVIIAPTVLPNGDAAFVVKTRTTIG